ncbi:MAG: hypothetical protein ABFC96_09030 [Thermoguttaceae bacterium]
MRRIVLSLAVLLMVCFVVADSASARGRRGCCGWDYGCGCGCGYYSSCWDGYCGSGCGGYYSGCGYYSSCGTTCCDHQVGCCQPNVQQRQQQQQKPMKPMPEPPSGR